MNAEVISLQKACSGKCRGDCATPRLWVLAVCEGMTAVFEKNEATGLMRSGACHMAQHSVIWEENIRHLEKISQKGAMRQLIVVGAPHDILWARQMLPESLMRSLIAEIPYPLLAAWFRPETPESSLLQAMASVMGTESSASSLAN